MGPSPEDHLQGAGYLHEGDCNCVESATGLHNCIMGRQRLKLVGRGDKWQPGVVRHCLRAKIAHHARHQAAQFCPKRTGHIQGPLFRQRDYGATWSQTVSKTVSALQGHENV